MPRNVIIKNTRDEQRIKFEQVLLARQGQDIRTADAMRTIVLLPGPDGKKTELADFPPGKVDPQIQLVLIARDEYMAAEDSIGKLGFFKAMRDVYQMVDSKIPAAMKMVMEERHHREKLEALERKAGLDEPDDEEVDATIKEDA